MRQCTGTSDTARNEISRQKDDGCNSNSDIEVAEITRFYECQVKEFGIYWIANVVSLNSVNA